MKADLKSLQRIPIGFRAGNVQSSSSRWLELENPVWIILLYLCLYVLGHCPAGKRTFASGWNFAASDKVSSKISPYFAPPVFLVTLTNFLVPAQKGISQSDAPTIHHHYHTLMWPKCPPFTQSTFFYKFADSSGIWTLFIICASNMTTPQLTCKSVLLPDLWISAALEAQLRQTLFTNLVTSKFN